MRKITKLIASSWIAIGAIALTASVHAQTGQWTTRSGPPDVLENSAVLSLSNGKVILAGGILSAGRNTAASAEVEVYDPGHDSWAQLPPMPAPQYNATAALLADGSILIAGGISTFSETPLFNPPLVTNAVLFDPAKDAWVKLPQMPFAETGATATRLDDGRILVAGGVGDNGVLQAAAIFDPSTDSWAPTSPMRTPRYAAVFVLLKNGQVLVAGGSSGPGQPLSEAELYDPNKGTWRSAGTMTVARVDPSALVLPDGRVLVTGGFGLASAEFYDPSSGSWNKTTSMPFAGLGQAFLLASGDVLALTINGADHTVYSALFNTQTTDWAAGPNLRVSSPYPPAEVQLPDRTVIVLGGGTVASFGNASVPPPNAAAVATKAANSSTTTIVLAIGFVVLLLALGMVYVWKRTRTIRASS
jgi:large repetitive protein